MKPNLQLSVAESDKPTITTWEHGQVWDGVSTLTIELGDAHWYGGGGLVHQQYPLEKLAQYPAPFITSDNGHTGLLGILEPFWWNSLGDGLWVESDNFTFSFNAPLEGEPPAHSFQDAANNDKRPHLAFESKNDGHLTITGENLKIRFFNGENAKHTVELFWQLLNISTPPPHHLLQKPLWTTWAHFKNNINQENITDYLQNLEKHGFGASVFGIDAKWQQEFGDSRFDIERFPNPEQLIEHIHELGAEATVWTIPFYMQTSQHFESANKQGYTFKDKAGETYIGTWWEGEASFLDVSDTQGLSWHLDNLTLLAQSVGLDSFKFDAGEAMFFVNDELQWDGVPNQATTHYIKELSERYPWSDVRCGWRNQSHPMLFRQWDKSTRWGFDNGLASCISQAIMLNMLGYPYSFPDMIGGNQYNDEITAELLIRWTQAVAPMPIIQFSVPPWHFDEECIQICKKYVDLHADLADRNFTLAQQQVPIVRPLWWIDPQSPEALVCDDQYLIGDDLLVAPIVHAGHTSRDIYLPKGKWRSYWHADEVHGGQCWLTDYPAPLDVLPLFVRV